MSPAMRKAGVNVPHVDKQASRPLGLFVHRLSYQVAAVRLRVPAPVYRAAASPARAASVLTLLRCRRRLATSVTCVSTRVRTHRHTQTHIQTHLHTQTHVHACMQLTRTPAHTHTAHSCFTDILQPDLL